MVEQAREPKTNKSSHEPLLSWILRQNVILKIITIVVDKTEYTIYQTKNNGMKISRGSEFYFSAKSKVELMKSLSAITERNITSKDVKTKESKKFLGNATKEDIANLDKSKKRQIFEDHKSKYLIMGTKPLYIMRQHEMSEENWNLLQQNKTIKLPSPLVSKRMDKRTMKIVHEKLFYIVKKSPHGKTTTMFHCYDMETRDFILCDHDKERLLRRLKQDYYKYKEKYNEH